MINDISATTLLKFNIIKENDKRDIIKFKKLYFVFSCNVAIRDTTVATIETNITNL